jgi:5-methylcytosine-specific restriction endonuclease McrA
MKVFVLSQERKPLMPTTPRRARLWLKAKRARVVCREPFTIQLRFETTAYTQPVTVGVDTGSQTVGIAATANREVVFQAEVHLRTDVSLKLIQRRRYRHTRRSRKTRYRAARWANRCRHAGWLPPSLRAKADATVKAVRFVARVLPIRQINVEIGSFDTQKMQNPEVSGVSYQQGQLQGYLLREYLLAKWQRQCAYCQTSGVPLQVEHLVPKSRGGSDRASNLVIACDACNKRKGTRTAEEFGYPDIQAQARMPLKDAAHVSSIKTAVVKPLAQQFGSERVAVTYGYETKYQRIQVLNLPKSHANDAVAIACEIGEIVKPGSSVYQIRCIPRGNYQLYNGKRSEHTAWAPRKVKGWKLYELVEAKGQLGYIGGRRVKGAFVVKDVVSRKTLIEVTPCKLHRLSRPVQGWMITRFPFSQIAGTEGGASTPS